MLRKREVPPWPLRLWGNRDGDDGVSPQADSLWAEQGGKPQDNKVQRSSLNVRKNKRFLNSRPSQPSATALLVFVRGHGFPKDYSLSTVIKKGVRVRCWRRQQAWGQ